MKWKVTLKFLYLITLLFVMATYKKDNEPQLIDSDLKVDPIALQQAYNKA